MAGMARALRERGLRERLGAADGGVVVPPPYRPEREAATGVRNGAAIGRYSRRLAEVVGEALDGGEFPVLVGGDCSIVLGAAVALRRRGRYGLAFVDGHNDFRHPGGGGPVGAVAGEDLAIVTGRGAAGLADLDGLRPYVRDEDVVAIGQDGEGDEETGFGRTAIVRRSANEVRARGGGAVGGEAAERLSRAPVAGFWLHLDVDVLDERVMPAVDSPNPAGLAVATLGELLAALLAGPGAVGMDVTIYDPTLDPGGELAELIVGVVVGALA